MDQINKLVSYIIEFINQFDYILIIKYVFKWLLISLLIGILVGSSSAFFVYSLNYVTEFRIQNTFILYFLPIAGLNIGLIYHYWGKDVVKGTNLLIDEIKNQNKIIPFKMAPLILISTLMTHLFGGSAGREGTAVQMGASIADQFTSLFKLKNNERVCILMMGISAGFASVFGTPLAGVIFALELAYLGKPIYKNIFHCLLSAYIAYYIFEMYGIVHTHYKIESIPFFDFINLIYCIVAGFVFGLTALLFSKSITFWQLLFKRYISFPPLRPFIGGIIIVLVVYFFNFHTYIGLGIPIIEKSFIEPRNNYDFLLKLLFTTFTLGAGFKGGEVTPLFFVGATLGNVLIYFIPLPLSLLAGMGFVAVFAGAANTPLACIFMGIELFGVNSVFYIAITCLVSYFSSGNSGIYTSQLAYSTKYFKLFTKK